MKGLFTILILTLLTACAPSTSADFKNEGESLCRSLIHDLQNIETYDDLLAHSNKIRKKINKLCDLMIQAKKSQIKNPTYAPDFDSSIVSDLLAEELDRVYTIENCKEFIENLERDALHRLDDFDRSIKEQTR
ncbi:MAG: hypothetical protein S4CHLAM102_04040 [Chlamydiia bacterium]|nr:hypothetical protein [Chlamydiia bacterium]